MIVQKLRLEKGWSQEHLAQVSGLSVRTVQRIERGQKAGPESLKCLAAVFETDVSKLQHQAEAVEAGKIEPPVASGKQGDSEGVEYVQNLKAFHLNWICFLIVVPSLYGLNIYVSPDYLWVGWIVLGWGIGIILHALVIYGLFSLFDTRWEQRQLQKRLNRRR